MTGDVTHGSAPAGWPRFLVVVLGLAGLTFSVQFVQGMQALVAPTFLALNLVLVVYPLQGYLIRMKVPAFIAAVVNVLVVMLLIAAFFGLNAWSIAELIAVIPQYSDKLTQLYGDVLTWLTDVGVTPGFIDDKLSNFDATSLTDPAIQVLSNVSSVVGLLTTVIMAVFFVAMDSLSFPERLQQAGKAAPEFTRAMSSFAKGVRRYWIVATIFGLIVAVFDVVALWIIGVPLALVWGVLAFITNYIPNVGLIIGLVPPAIMALLNGGWWDALWVVIAYLVLNFVIQSIIQPKFTGESVGVTPFISFASLLFWYWVLGPMGALLALPATLLVKALLVDADPKARWINSLIASDLTTGAGLPVHHHKPATTREVLDLRLSEPVLGEVGEGDAAGDTQAAGETDLGPGKKE